MSIHLRWKTYSTGTKSAYLDIYSNGERKYEFLDIQIFKGDSQKKEKIQLAKTIRDKRSVQEATESNEIITKAKKHSCLLVYIENFLDNYEKKGIRKYEGAKNKLLDYLKDKGHKGRLPFYKVNAKLCEGYKDYLISSKAKLSGETPQAYLKKFRSILHQAVRDGYLLKNPCAGLSIKQPQDSIKKDILTSEEIKTLAATPCGNDHVKRAFIFACFTGMGEKEIRSLQWKNVVNSRLKVQRSKNGEPVDNKLSTTALALLGDRADRDSFIFNLPSTTAVTKNLKSWCTKAKIDKHITFYCGRHSFAIMALQQGTNLKVLADLMGHSSVRFTTKYLNHVNKPKDEAIDNLPNIQIT